MPIFTDLWEEDKPSKNVRYIPIQVETGYPSTSTPNEGLRLGCSTRNVPIKLVEMPNGPSTPARKPRIHTPVYKAIIDENEDDEVS